MAFIRTSQDATDIPPAKYSAFSSGGGQGQNTHGLQKFAGLRQMYQNILL